MSDPFRSAAACRIVRDRPLDFSKRSPVEDKVTVEKETGRRDSPGDWLKGKKMTAQSGSPIQRLRLLQPGWDGYDSDPLSIALLDRAEKFWTAIMTAVHELELDAESLPSVNPGRDGVIGFTWQQDKRSLTIWLYSEPEGFAEWSCEGTPAPQSGECVSDSELKKLWLSYVSRSHAIAR